VGRLRAAVGLGANLGDRLATLRGAARALGALAVDGRLLASSRVYETAPIGGPEQPAFLNAAVLLDYDGAPLALLEALLAIEARFGRERRERWGPRTLDLDVLWIEGLAVNDPRLVVPHPRLSARAFAVLPLLDVAPGARDPASGAAYVVPRDGANADVRDTGERL
jgi:2-amino-4-hydroxy-6-hydroxymethyldihydropteridine diphosphokinase